ncbi:anaphase promoting complex subunit 10 [Plasmodium cynomolgi strain B]|uniref:Anaphase-promoting complex subunit 10 n=1 Tax=Plasmodium cynomolgi (strain B) TaxID=1120755 RepID=K6UEV5_PLACD|nr:anaphase promoting complex subunit 10 [Plasmodium cynomolgi strain B]GAB69011.1 anaphase promoting complex subunit 10 [Plasmodium cynomolgi strain B]
MPPIHLSKKYIDVGCLATWKLSSSKSKSDTKKLKDNNVNTYWQSSGLGPHTITIQFFKLTKISKIYLLFNYLLDESYTPYEISIKVGNDENRLDVLCTTFCDVNKYPVDDPFWFIIDLAKFQLHSYFYNYNMNAFKRTNFIYCRCIQICVMSSQHYGRDTRIRQHDKSLIL